MHEQSIAKRIIEEAQKQGKVKAATVECGELAHLPAAELEKVLEGMAPFKVKVVERPSVVSCASCGFEGSPRIEMRGHDFNVFFCRKCGEVPEIVEGKDIVLKSVEVE